MNKFKFLAYTLACVVAFGNLGSAVNNYYITTTVGNAPKNAKEAELFINFTLNGTKQSLGALRYEKNTSHPIILNADSIQMMKSDSACTPEDYKHLPPGEKLNISLTHTGKGKSGHWECAIK